MKFAALALAFLSAAGCRTQCDCNAENAKFTSTHLIDMNPMRPEPMIQLETGVVPVVISNLSYE